MDFRITKTTSGAALTGDITRASVPPRLTAHLLGTAPFKQIDVIKNNKYVHQLSITVLQRNKFL
jgi:hypothetical protein